MFLPPVPEMSDLLQALEGLGVETHLQGYLGAEGEFPFVDICHYAAERVQDSLLPEFRLIYPSPISSAACLRGLDDPLQLDGGVSADSWIREQPGYTDLAKEHELAMREQVSYLRRQVPSRLVRVDVLAPDRLKLQIQQLTAVLSPP